MRIHVIDHKKSKKPYVIDHKKFKKHFFYMLNPHTEHANFLQIIFVPCFLVAVALVAPQTHEIF